MAKHCGCNKSSSESSSSESDDCHGRRHGGRHGGRRPRPNPIPTPAAGRVVAVTLPASAFGTGVVTGSFYTFTAPLASTLPIRTGAAPAVIGASLAPTALGAPTISAGPVFSASLNTTTAGGSVILTVDSAAVTALGLGGLYTGTTLTAPVTLYLLI